MKAQTMIIFWRALESSELRIPLSVRRKEAVVGCPSSSRAKMPRENTSPAYGETYTVTVVVCLTIKQSEQQYSHTLTVPGVTLRL